MHRSTLGCAALVFALSLSAFAKPLSNDEKEIQRFMLTSQFLEKIAGVQEKLAVLQKEHPELEKKAQVADRGHRDESIDGQVKTVESVPPLADAIKGQGLSVRQYVVGLSALLQASMYSAMKKQMPDMKAPEGMNMANVTFIETHRAEMDKLQRRGKAASGHGKQQGTPTTGDGEDEDEATK